MANVTSKTTMVSARVPSSLVERVDYVLRNTMPEDARNRSSAIGKALERWTVEQETILEKLGIKAPKK